MSRFSMILLAVLILGSAAVLALIAAVDFAAGHSAVGVLCAANAVVLAALWWVANQSWRAAGYWKRI
jgi:hypothetical protein